MAAMARCSLIPSMNPAHSFRHQFTQPNASFFLPPTLPNFLRLRRCGFPGQNRRRGITMAAGTDHYSTLNVNRNATLQEIKSAYRKLARKVTLRDSRLLLFFLYFYRIELKLRVCNGGTVSPGYEQEPWCRR